MSVVYKYLLTLAPSQYLQLPRGARILHVAAQGGVPCMWAEVDNNLPTQTRRFGVLTTGESFHPNDYHTYLGTFFLENRLFVGHVYERMA